MEQIVYLHHWKGQRCTLLVCNAVSLHIKLKSVHHQPMVTVIREVCCLSDNIAEQ
jgi:hypothetical protein